MSCCKAYRHAIESRSSALPYPAFSDEMNKEVYTVMNKLIGSVSLLHNHSNNDCLEVKIRVILMGKSGFYVLWQEEEELGFGFRRSGVQQAYHPSPAGVYEIIWVGCGTKTNELMCRNLLCCVMRRFLHFFIFSFYSSSTCSSAVQYVCTDNGTTA